MRKNAAITLFAAAVAAGCAPQPPLTTEPLPRLQIVETLETDADRLLNYYAYVTELQGETLEREYRYVEKAYSTDPNEYNEMQMIILLASPRASFRDTDLARTMVRRWLQDEYYSYSKLRPLAMLYYSYLSELKRQNRVIDQAKKSLRQANEQSAQQAEQIKASQQRSKELQDKLDALLEMERSLIEREEITQPDKQ